MSTISASTTTTTAYKVTADTTGTLVLQTGATPTTAMTISSAQVVNFANAPTVAGSPIGASAATPTALGTVYGSMTTGGSSPSLTALGYNAAPNATGIANTAVGHRALITTTTGDSNTAIGKDALYNNLGGSGNTAVGYNPMDANTSGGQNTAIGYQALKSNTTSSNNTAVGYQAGYTGTTATRNTLIGFKAGYALTTGSTNTFIGVRSDGIGASGAAITTGSNNTIIGGFDGNNGVLDIRTTSNYIVLSDGDGNPRGVFDNNGRFMVGTTTQSNGQFGYATRITSSSTTESIMAITNNASATGYYPLLVWQTATSGNNLLVGFYTEGGITLRGGIDYNRGAGQVRYNTTSDATLKNVIGDAPRQKSIDILNSTRIREYSWKNDPTNKAQIGVIAQELHETFNGAVSVGGEDTVVDDAGNEVTRYRPWAVDKTAFTFHLVAGFQHLFEQVQELKAELDVAKAEIAALKGQA